MTEELYKKYSEEVRYYLLDQVGKREVAKDLTQDTFNKVLSNKEKLKNVDNHEAWVFRIAQNTLIDYTRKKKEDSLIDSEIIDSTDFHEQVSDIELISDCLYELIEEYSQEQQDILLDVFTKSLTQKEAANYLDLPYSTFKSRVQKARSVILAEFRKRCCQLKYNQHGEIIGCESAK
ncbi:sigma-70 family RNA polymerase sigma factor [Fodinibius saliphilus]|uniref:sigma-70 family RNA polymerase sigma factor n=1 Tax=Fodinibius saliphilus TaxID=1920650 RepID=UPI001108EE9B|nr:sigma-70 family RNA polymerase sigma factor [Fodinibius saliphilus]